MIYVGSLFMWMINCLNIVSMNLFDLLENQQGGSQLSKI
jgi:hypothetical protein